MSETNRTEPEASEAVTVRVFGGLREHVRHGALLFSAKEAPTLARLLACLDRDEADLARALRDGLRQGYLNTLVNGRNARFLAGDDTKLAAGDSVAFLPPIGGG